MFKHLNQTQSWPVSVKKFYIVLLFFIISNTNGERIEILMSNVTTQKEDAYMCTSYKLDENQLYITNIQPLATADIAHHMFAYGCEKPALASNSWNCGDNVCKGQKTILFAWGRNAPPLQLPDDVAYNVGPNTNYKYIVVNIHYLKKVNNDRSGLAITVSDKARRYQAGIMLMVAGYIGIPPNTKKYSTPISCKYSGKTIKVFAFRVHAHMHGDVNAAYKVENNEWTQLALGNPQWPQAFYPTDSLIDVKDGNALVGVCTYHNDESRYVYAGATHTDEMCNVYLMYYADSTSDVMDTCAGNTYPQLESVLPAEATVVPSPPASFNINSENKDSMSHHDMEGSKMHHELSDSSFNKNSDSNKQLSKSLINLLSQGLSNNNGDDYYDDVERSRSKSRNGDKSDDTNANNANSDDALYDTNDLIDALSSDNSLDYQAEVDPGLLLASTIDKIANGKSSNLNKIKFQLNSVKAVSTTKYTNIENWYDPKTINLGQVGGISINQKSDKIVIFHRASQLWQQDSFTNDYRFNTRKYSIISENTMVVLNRLNGKLVDSWGSNLFYMPHGLKIDSEGNIWVTDVGRHQVLKFAPNNTKEPILAVGEQMVPGNDRNHFCQPADIAILKNGDFFVADGYCNSRIAKFNKAGEYLTEWSSEEEGMPSHFFVPHSLALHETQNLLCVADRENYRVQCFDLAGNFLHETVSADFGPIYGVAFAANNASVLYAVNGFNSRLETQFEKKVFLISVKTGNLMGSISLVESAKTPHALALTDDASEIYVANLNPPTIVKYALLNYKIGVKGDSSKRGNGTSKLVNGDKENFRTSMFIMAFLAIPLVLVVVAALILRLKNTGKLRKLNLVGVSNGVESKHKELGKWIRKTTNSKKRNGFTRLNQESDGEENERLHKQDSLSSNGPGRLNSDSEDTEEDEITLPTLSKA